MPISSCSSLMMLPSKLVPHLLRSLASAPKIEIYPCHRNLAMVFAVLSGATWAMMYFIKWSQKTSTFDVWCSSIVISMLVKSMCSSSKGAVAMIGCIGALAQVLSCWMHCSHLLITLCICVAMLGHQNWSCSRYIYCWPWCSTSLWHPFMAATQWAVGTKTTGPLPAGMPVYGSDRGLLDRASGFSTLEGQQLPPKCLCYLPRDASDSVLYNWRFNRSRL